MRKLAFAFVLILAGCATNQEVRWGQAQSLYNATMATLVSYRAPCVDVSPDHPLCKIDDEQYALIEAVRVRADSVLRRMETAEQLGQPIDVLLAEFQGLLQTLLMYKLQAEGGQA